VVLSVLLGFFMLAAMGFSNNIDELKQELVQEAAQVDTLTQRNAELEQENSKLTAQTSSSSASTSADATSGDSATAQYDINNVDAAVKEFGDSFEEFADRYADFMTSYKSAGASAQANMIADYSSLAQQEIDMTDKAKKLDGQQSTWNTDTQKYWIDLYARCTQKILGAL
jgi:regulator of replication initiation timing